MEPTTRPLSPTAPLRLAALALTAPLRLAAIALMVELCSTCSLAAAAVPSRPIHWTDDTARAEEPRFEAYHGEQLDFQTVFNAFGAPLQLDGNTVSLYWQTNGMGEAWWSTPATVSGNVARAEFAPSMDPGARAMTAFFGVSGATGRLYRAARIIFKNSPGATPNAIPFPVKVLDFASLTIANAPYYTKQEVLDAISNALVNAVFYDPATSNLTYRVLDNPVQE